VLQQPYDVEVGAGTMHRKPALRELREASLGWIEHHTERKLATRELLEKI